jgi:hypothetical protein
LSFPAQDSDLTVGHADVTTKPFAGAISRPLAFWASITYDDKTQDFQSVDE